MLIVGFPYSRNPVFPNLVWKLSASQRIVKSRCGTLFYTRSPLPTSEVLVRYLCRSAVPVSALALLLLSCADQGPNPINPGVDCDAATPVVLNPGESLVLSATANNGCIEIPGAGGSGARHLVVAYSGAGTETENGVVGPFALASQSVASASAIRCTNAIRIRGFSVSWLRQR